MPAPTDLPILPFADQAALEAWLEAAHATAPGLYVQIARKGSGIPSVTSAAVEAAQADGQWARAYPGPATATVPDDLAAALAAEPGARAAFDALGGQDRFAILFRVHTAATPAGRAKRIATAVRALTEGPGGR